MKCILFCIFIAAFFTACVHDSTIITKIGVMNDYDPAEFAITDEIPVMFPDETADEMAEETQDISVDEEIDESVEHSDHAVDEAPDGTIDETPDGTIDETPDDDYIFEVPDSMVLIPAGEFWMGAPEEEEGRYWNHPTFDELLHYVVLTKSFYMDKYEVTQGDFEALMAYNPSFFGPNFLDKCGSDCPVEQVNWYEAAEYANKRSDEFGLEQCFECEIVAEKTVCELKDIFSKPQDCRGFRFPTEAEWEYAARAGTTSAFYSGEMLYTEMEPLDLNLDAIAWYKGNSGTEENGYVCYEDTYCSLHPVGGKLPNNFGLYDMSGNVAEWTMDWYREYPYGDEKFPVVDPWAKIQGTNRIYRGGDYYVDSFICRSAYRSSFGKGNKFDSTIGFRLVKTE